MRQVQDNQSLLIFIFIAFATIWFVTGQTAAALQNEVAGLKEQDVGLSNTIVNNRKLADEAFRHATARFDARAADVDESFEAFNEKFEKKNKAQDQSIDATNLEVESVKATVATYNAATSADIANVRTELAGVSSDLSSAKYELGNGVRNNAARSDQIYDELTKVAGGLDAFYNDISGKVEWGVQGPGGCNDGFKGESPAHPWQMTRSFVHSQKKVSLSQCKLLCKAAKWGCNYISFYGAKEGWCYGFQSCNEHSTGRGWGGYTTYERRTLDPLGGKGDE